jgi:hypothetical protein
MGIPQKGSLRWQQVVTRFPGLGRGHFRFTSPDDPMYNCLAWAGHETTRCWHPSAFGGLYWPGGEGADTTQEWVAAFTRLGYVECGSATHEIGVERLAIYADAGLPLHIARQLPNGWWTSKLGPREDIEHELHGLVGKEYGRVVCILSRPDGGQVELPIASAWNG